jgi:hypothetical protein
MEDCKPCPFGHTSRPGTRHIEECEPVPQACPVGQIALLGAVSPQQCVCLPGHGGKTGSGWQPALELFLVEQLCACTA